MRITSSLSPGLHAYAWRASASAFVPALAIAGAGCAVPGALPVPPTAQHEAVHRIWVVHHGRHSGLVVRALLWPTPAVLHVVAFDGPVERYFAEAGLIELTLTAPGFAALVGAVRHSHQRVPAAGEDSGVDWPPPLGPGLSGASRFYAPRERFHLFRTCNAWTAGVLAAAGAPLRQASALTADSLFAQLRPHGRLLREPP